VATLRRRGAIVLDPASGRLTGADSGPGRLPEPSEIFEAALSLLRRSVLRRGPAAAPDLAGLRVLITAGGTREPLDPVRYLGNRSSGLQGYALARAAVARGAEVTLIAANVALPDPAGVKMLRAGTALELRDEVRAAAVDADVVVMSAAVADFRPADYADAKIKKTDDSSAPELTLVQNPHILAELGRERLRAGQTVVGFAAETGDAEHSALELGRRKLAKYGVDLLVVNEVGVDKVFGRPETEAVILDATGTETAVPPGPKSALAEEVWDRVAAWRADPRG
jgi:phosphopantothenoylcysteine decarboxylase/phosphopantothenate--cysteine ligase